MERSDGQKGITGEVKKKKKRVFFFLKNLAYFLPTCSKCHDWLLKNACLENPFGKLRTKVNFIRTQEHSRAALPDTLTHSGCLPRGGGAARLGPARGPAAQGGPSGERASR